MSDLIAVKDFAVLIAAFILIAAGFLTGLNAVSIGGMRVLFKRLPDFPPEIRPHMRRSLVCLFTPASCMLVPDLARTHP